MNEFFLAGDSVDLWQEVSRDALKKAGFIDIKSAPDGTLSARRGGTITLGFKPSKEGGVVIEIDTDDPADAGLYKQYAAQSYNALKTLPAVVESEPLGSPESVKPDMSQAFKPAFPSESKPAVRTEPAVDTRPATEARPAAEVKPAVEPEEAQRVPFYETDWFTLLLLILLPPVGLILMWAFKVFDKKLRIGLTVFFILYTVLWGWLLYLPFIPSETIPEEETTSQTEELNAYWDNMYVTEFRQGIPPQMDEYQSLYLNGMLVSETGLSRARVILPAVQALCTQVLSLEALPESDPAYPVQQTVNAAANSFNNAIAAGQDALASNDPYGLADTTDLWNTAMNDFYQIDYIYEQALYSAEVADGLIEEDTKPVITQDTVVTPAPTPQPEQPQEPEVIEEETQVVQEDTTDVPEDAAE